jgi:hypothetical protein
MMTPTINLLFKNTATGDKVRLIDINYQTERAMMFNCLKHITDCGMPYSIPLSELGTMIAENQLEIVDDCYIRNVDDKDLSKRQIEIRDRAYEAIRDIVDSPDIFSPILRLRLVKKVRKRTKLSKPTIYKYIKKYWLHGMNINALLPDWELCGAAGCERESGVSDKTRKIIRKTFKEFVIDKQFSVDTALKYVNKEYKKELGCKLEYHTFYLHGRSAFPEEDLRRAKNGDKYFEANERMLSGRSNDIVDGPCKLYQIDSTPRDIRIVSSLNRNQYIGKPTFYVVVDAWSRAVVGVLITLDNPSYITACQALFIAFRSKDVLIRELGLGPEHLGWSNSFLPIELVADRAEFLGPKADNIIRNFKIRIGNTSAYRPDLKGICEKIIDLVQERVWHLFLNRGQISSKEGHRMAKDTREDATVTLDELYQITWIVVNEHNNYHWIDEYPLTDQMVADGVKKIPAEIHKWGIEHNLGSERMADEKTLWFNLMDSTEAIPSRKGVRLNKQDYVPEGKVEFKLMEQLILKPTVKPVKIIFDPRVYKNIYWVHNDAFIKLRLRGDDDVQYQNIWEYQTNNEAYNEMKKEAKATEADMMMANNEIIEGIIEENLTNQRKSKKNSKSAKSLEAEFNRSKINNIPETESDMTSSTKVIAPTKPHPLKVKMELVND